MKRIDGRSLGIDQGSALLFSDYENGGDMWSGTGPRERRLPVRFGHPFRSAPAVMVAISMWDTDSARNQRAEISAEEVTAQGFQIAFRTWGDSRVARVRASWTAFGELAGEDDWDVD